MYKLFGPILRQNFTYLRKAQIVRNAYQFRVDTPVYYPDRNSEAKRLNTVKSKISKDRKEQNVQMDYHYQVLGLQKTATASQIKSAFYALAKRYHPDSSNTLGQTRRFQEILNAYEKLSDLHKITDEKRNTFLPQLGNEKQPPEGKVWTREDLLRLTQCDPNIEITFMESVHGVQKFIELKNIKKCSICNGIAPKIAHQHSPDICRKCGGTGQIAKKTAKRTTMVPCETCCGRGKINKNDCAGCENRGFILETIKVPVMVPAACVSGDNISIAHPNTKQTLKFRLNVLPDKVFQRSNYDILSDEYLAFTDFVLGGTFRVRGIYKTFDIKVEPGTESNTKIQVYGMGIATPNGKVGNHIVTLKVRIPRTLSTKQRQLLLALANAE